MASVITIFIWLIVLLPQHCKPFTHSVYTITKIDDYRVLPLVVVLAMPDHRPHAPYVDVPKWERRRVLLWRLFKDGIGDLFTYQIMIFAQQF